MHLCVYVEPTLQSTELYVQFTEAEVLFRDHVWQPGTKWNHQITIIHFILFQLLSFVLTSDQKNISGM